MNARKIKRGMQFLNQLLTTKHKNLANGGKIFAVLRKNVKLGFFSPLLYQQSVVLDFILNCNIGDSIVDSPRQTGITPRSNCATKEQNSNNDFQLSFHSFVLSSHQTFPNLNFLCHPTFSSSFVLLPVSFLSMYVSSILLPLFLHSSYLDKQAPCKAASQLHTLFHL